MSNERNVGVSDVERQYPPEYFIAQVAFATTLAALAGVPIFDALFRYTALYRELVGKPPVPGVSEPLWVAFGEDIAHSDDPATISDSAYRHYCAQPHSVYNPHRNREGARVFGALGYAYATEQRQVRVHFFTQRSATSALSGRYTRQRRADFARLLLDVRQRHPTAAELTSSTWLQNLPNYRQLFPQSFTDRLRDVGGGSYLGVWGQFVKGDGTANLARLAEFRAGLSRAQTIDATIAAIPLKVLEAVGPLQEFYDEYGL